MNKISREDLEQLFEKKSTKEQSDLVQEEKVAIHKSKRTPADDLVLKSVRRKIHKISQKDKARGFDRWDSFLRFVAIAGFSGFITIMALSFPAYLNQLKWFYYVDYLGENIPVKTSQTPTVSASPNTTNQLKLPNLKLSTTSTESTLIIPRISVNAPVIWDVEESNILDQLKSGVVHYKGTALPGESGNVFIVGHSSNYFWVKSDYNNIFSLLDKLSVGDRIEIKKDGKSYFYDVFGKKEVSPQDVEVLKSPNQILTLMTCWPVGTSLNRLIVQANFAYASN